MRKLMLLVIVAGIGVLRAEAQAPVAREPQMQKTTVGSELFRFYCSNCHVYDAKGRPATPAMRVPAPDLTSLAANNGGSFPRERVRAIIEQGSGSHQSSGMPVWGAIFRALEPNDAMVRVRVDNLVTYVESLQAVTSRTTVQ